MRDYICVRLYALKHIKAYRKYFAWKLYLICVALLAIFDITALVVQ